MDGWVHVHACIVGMIVMNVMRDGMANDGEALLSFYLAIVVGERVNVTL